MSERPLRGVVFASVVAFVAGGVCLVIGMLNAIPPISTHRMEWQEGLLKFAKVFLAGFALIGGELGSSVTSDGGDGFYSSSHG